MDRAEIESTVLTIVKGFIAETNPNIPAESINLGSQLDQFSVDSLGRMELFSRIKLKFNINIAETCIFNAESVNDIVLSVLSSSENKAYLAYSEEDKHIITSSSSNRGNTLVEVLSYMATKHPDFHHIYLVGEDGAEEVITYAGLLENAKQIAKGLCTVGLKPQETVAIMLKTEADFFYTFFGVLLAGGIPVPIYPPLRLSKIGDYIKREAKILEKAEVKFLITFAEAKKLSHIIKPFVSSLKAVCMVDDLRLTGDFKLNHIIRPEDTALIQFTSGSTNTPKGVKLSHRNIISNIDAIGRALNLNSTDTVVSWLPLYHDMGLIGAWLNPFFYNFPTVIMSPLSFLTAPEIWLWKIHEHKATVSTAPNFAYELCVKKIQESNIKGLNLSSWRLALNGAEKVQTITINNFVDKFEKYGFQKKSMTPVYGLAESSVALIIPELNREPVIDIVNKDVLELENKAIPCNKNDAKAIDIASCGVPLHNHEVKIFKTNSAIEAAEREVGRLFFKGPSVMTNYYRDLQETKQRKIGEYLDSGDLAYIADNEIYIVGRTKDVIIKAGKNIYPYDIEAIAGEVDGVRKGCVIAFSADDATLGTEKIIVVAEAKTLDNKLKTIIVNEVFTKLDITIDEIELIKPHQIPKTSSGKLQRTLCKQEYLQNKLNKKSVPFLMQVMQLFVQGQLNKLYGLGKTFLKLIYTGYVGVILAGYILTIWAACKILKKDHAYKTSSYLSKLLFKFAGCELEVEGLDNLKDTDNLVFVANHQSYIDSIALIATLPKYAVFFAKKEVLDMLIIRTIFAKLGYLVIDREDVTKSAEYITLMTRVLAAGNSIIIFPEGGITESSELRPFKLGAFQAAVTAKKAVCPIFIDGTIDILRDEDKLLCPGKITIKIMQPIIPESKDWKEVVDISTKAKDKIANA